MQERLEQAHDARLVDLEAGIADGADSDRMGKALEEGKVDMAVEPLGQDVVLLAYPLLGPLDRDGMIARIGLHPALIVVRPLAQRLLADLGDANDVAEEVHHQLRPGQRRQIAVNDNPVEAVIDEDQELAEQLGEQIHGNPLDTR
jgi:hypothetical protein